MKKRLLIIGFIVLSLIACNKNGKQELSENVLYNEKDKTTINEEEVQKDVFSEFEEELKKSGIKYETVKMAANLIGAQDGMKYKIGDGVIELYRYDIDSDSYKTAEQTQSIYLDGFGSFEAKVKNGIAILIRDLDEEKYTAIINRLIE